MVAVFFGRGADGGIGDSAESPMINTLGWWEVLD